MHQQGILEHEESRLSGAPLANVRAAILTLRHIDADGTAGLWAALRSKLKCAAQEPRSRNKTEEDVSALAGQASTERVTS